MSNSEVLPAPTLSTTVKKTTTRARILQAAQACFADKGYYQTTMDDIAAESGLSKGALYWHFKSKRDLFISLNEWFMNGVGEEVSQIWTDGSSATDKIRGLTMAFADKNEYFNSFFKATFDFWSQTPEDAYLQRLFNTQLDRFQEQLSTIIEEGIASGEFRPVDAPELSVISPVGIGG